MGVLIHSKENELIDIIRQDLSEKMNSIIIKNNINKNILIGPNKRTLIHFCAYFGSVKCLKELIKKNFDINELEGSNNNSPLFIACKFNYIEIVHILLNNDYQKCEILRKNNDGLNEFEVAFLCGNYEICYYLLYEYKNENEKEKIPKINENDNSETIIIIKNKENQGITQNNQIVENEYIKFFNDINFSLEKYLGIQEYLSYPLFNMPLFYTSLKEKIIPGENPSFKAERKKTKDLLTKIPDPNESWGNFMKRLVKLELYNPPLVDKNKISQANSFYMKTQMKLISMEYGINMDYCNPTDLKINNYINDIDEKTNLKNININEEKLDDENTNRENNKDEITYSNLQKKQNYFNINFNKNMDKINFRQNTKFEDKNKVKIYNKRNNNFENNGNDPEKQFNPFSNSINI